MGNPGWVLEQESRLFLDFEKGENIFFQLMKNGVSTFLWFLKMKIGGDIF